ncbi:hypothetical protein LPJ73_005534, partial [Coemansia sp. RSA 2703]
MKFTISSLALCAVLATAAVKAQSIDGATDGTIGGAIAIVNEKAGTKDTTASNPVDDSSKNNNSENDHGNGRDTENDTSASGSDSSAAPAETTSSSGGSIDDSGSGSGGSIGGNIG